MTTQIGTPDDNTLIPQPDMYFCNYPEHQTPFDGLPTKPISEYPGNGFPPTQIRDNPEHKGCLFVAESGLEVHHVKGSDLQPPDSHTNSRPSKALKAAEYKQLLTEINVLKLEQWYSQGTMQLENRVFLDTLGQCRAIIQKKLEELK